MRISTEKDEAEMVTRMADAMRAKLALNRGKLHWEESEMGYLMARLNDEVEELRREVGDIFTSDRAEKVRAEAADVANFAAMIAEKVRVTTW